MLKAIQQPSLFDTAWVMPSVEDNMQDDDSEIKITPGKPPTGTVTTWGYACKEFNVALKAFYAKFGKEAAIDKVYKTVSAAHGETTYFFIRKGK